jgi:hypothetical protein
MTRATDWKSAGDIERRVIRSAMRSRIRPSSRASAPSRELP